jgi:hypothetical protein
VIAEGFTWNTFIEGQTFTHTFYAFHSGLLLPVCADAAKRNKDKDERSG